MIRSGNVQVWLATGPVDMRKSFDTLAEHVRVFLGHDPLCGSMFVFRSRSAERMKVLWWDKEGLHPEVRFNGLGVMMRASRKNLRAGAPEVSLQLRLHAR